MLKSASKLTLEFLVFAYLIELQSIYIINSYVLQNSDIAIRILNKTKLNYSYICYNHCNRFCIFEWGISMKKTLITTFAVLCILIELLMLYYGLTGRNELFQIVINGRRGKMFLWSFIAGFTHIILIAVLYYTYPKIHESYLTAFQVKVFEWSVPVVIVLILVYQFVIRLLEII